MIAAPAAEAAPLSLQAALNNPREAAPATILHLQRTHGNRTVQGLVQNRLVVGPVGDLAERVASLAIETDPRPVQNQGEAEALQIKPMALSIAPGVWEPAGVLDRMRLQRQPAEEKKDDKTKKEEPKPADQIVAILKPGMTGLDFKTGWSSLEKQIKSPVADDKKKGKFKALYEAALVEALQKLSQADRVKVAEEVYNQLVQSLTGLSAADATVEFGKLDGFIQRNVEGGILGYVAMRGALFNTFGSINKINEYYQTLVPANFPSSKVKGSGMKVHPVLKDRLDRAAKVLRSHKEGDKTWFEIVEAGISGIGGFNIRENRNNPTALSDHSFGWAIDIDAALNPNIPMSAPLNPKEKDKTLKVSPTMLVKEFTGVDVYGGEAAKKIRAGGTTDELLASAQALRQASDAFKNAFESKDSLKTAFTSYLKSHGLTITAEQANTLLDILDPAKQAEAKTDKKKKGKAAKKEKPADKIAQWLSEAKAQQEAKAKTTAAAPASTPAPAPVAPQPAVQPWAEAKQIANFLVLAYGVFQGTRTKKGAKIPATVTGTPQTIAAHGFLNLPAQLIAALAGSDGGDLKWLGSIQSGTKDFMHFELKKSDHPSLPKEESKPAEKKPE